MKGDKEKYDDEMDKAEGEEEATEEEAPDKGDPAEEEAKKEEEAEKGCKKSDDLDEDDLQKSLDLLNDLANEGDATSRKDYLLSKAQTETLDDGEREELFGILGGTDGAPEPSLADEVVKGLEENDEMQKAMDVSNFIDESSKEMVKAMRTLSDHVEQGDNRQHEFNLILARAVSETGKMVKSMSEALDVMSGQPARPPKSKGVQTMEKSFAGAPPAGDQLSKSQILDELEVMNLESISKGMGGATEDGFDLTAASSKYEQFGQISPVLLRQVQARIKTKAPVA